MIGKVFVLAGLISTALSFAAYSSALRGARTLVPWGRRFFILSMVSVFGASALLLNNLLAHKFQYNYVWSYSSTDLPFSLLLSTFYAGQEGSFMLWALMTAIVGIFLMRYSMRQKIEAETMAMYGVILLFLFVMLVVKSPFAYIWETHSDLLRRGLPPPPGTSYVVVDETLQLWAQIPFEGRGLNPLLQNYWMVLHPPMLFLGFVMMAVPYTFALAGLIKKDWHSWIAISMPWLVAGALILGVGIMMGGYWAYETLGWGGYWGWDPVENSSLVPWILSIALIHTAIVQRKNNSFVKTNFVVAILTFVSVIYSTFLTRSGVLAETSVHSFADPGMWAYWMLLGFLLLFLALGFGLLANRWRDLRNEPAEHNVLSREFALFSGAFVLVLSGILITVGTSAPLITSLLQGKASAVEISYYVRTNLPIGIIIAALAGLSQFLLWQTTEKNSFLRASLWTGAVALIPTILVFQFGWSNVGILLFVYFSSFALLANVRTAYKMFRENPAFLGGSLSHVGLAIMFLGFVTTSVYDSKQHLALELNASQNAYGYTMTYEGAEQQQDGKFKLHVKLEKDGKMLATAPVMYFSEQMNSLVRNPDIVNLFEKDLYIEPISLEPAGVDSLTQAHKHETLIIEASVKPYINLVWLGTITLMIGLAIAVYRRTVEARVKRNSTP